MSISGGSGAGRVIVVGAINIDLAMRLPRLPAPGETVLGGVLARHHGGKGANQAVAAARAGARVHLIGAVGAGDGQESVDALAAEGVGVGHVRRGDVPTGHAMVLVDAAGENQIAVAPGANELVTADHVDDSIEVLGLQPADVVVLSFEVPAVALRVAAGLAGWIGAHLIVNPAPVQPDYAGLVEGAIATPNITELRGLLAQAGMSGSAGAGPADLASAAGQAAAAAALAGHTGAPVALTVGADGVVLAADGQVERLAGHRVEAVDTTGAGDTLTGVLAAGLADGYSLRASLRRAVAAAALTVTKAGARAGMPTAAEVDALLG
jgi:ribokinase